jgi:hypothetical protein
MTALAALDPTHLRVRRCFTRGFDNVPSHSGDSSALLDENPTTR